MANAAGNIPFAHFDRHLRHDAFWFIGIGLVMIIAGVVMATDLALATMAATLYIGVMMVLGGTLQIAHALAIRRFHSPWLWALFGLFYLLAGTLIWIHPTFAISALTFALALLLLAAGVSRLVVGLSLHREGRGWLVSSAILTMAAGILVSLGWPADSAWVLGLFLCADFIAQGCALMLFGVAIRSA